MHRRAGPPTFFHFCFSVSARLERHQIAAITTLFIFFFLSSSPPAQFGKTGLRAVMCEDVRRLLLLAPPPPSATETPQKKHARKFNNRIVFFLVGSRDFPNKARIANRRVPLPPRKPPLAVRFEFVGSLVVGGWWPWGTAAGSRHADLTHLRPGKPKLVSIQRPPKQTQPTDFSQPRQRAADQRISGPAEPNEQ